LKAFAPRTIELFSTEFPDKRFNIADVRLRFAGSPAFDGEMLRKILEGIGARDSLHLKLGGSLWALATSQ
jgi:hypothetical protein